MEDLLKKSLKNIFPQFIIEDMRKKGRLFLSTFLMFVFSAKIFAENSFFDNYVYRMWNSFGGLTGTTATDITQTKDGYINVGTYEGLVRFDGMEFSTLRGNSENDLHFVSVRAILEDSRGNLWLGSNDEGLQKISSDGNKSYTTDNGLPNNSVRALAEDKNGNIWVGTASGVVFLTPDGKLMTPQFEAGTVSKGVIAINFFCDSAGRMWLISAAEKGLFLFTDGLFRTRPELDQFGNYLATSICQDFQGNFLVGLSTQGIVKMSNGEATLLETNTSLDSTPTWANYVAKDGTIWFGSEKGLTVYSDGKFYEYGESGGFIAKINRIISDREGNIWFATDRNGIGKLTHGRFNMTKLPTSANSIAEGKAPNPFIWVGTDSGVRCYSGNKEITNELTEFTEGSRIRHISIAENGDLLVSCYAKPGQLRCSGDGSLEGMKSWTTDEGLAGNRVRVAIEGKNGEICVGTTTGLSIIYKDGRIKNLKQSDGLENEYVMCLHMDQNGVLWVGTDGGGIYLVKDGQILTHVGSENGLPGNIIFKIMQDKENAYWICTGSGITRCAPFNSGKDLPKDFFTISSEHGLATDSAFQMILDTEGNAWITSNYGIASVPFSEMQNIVSGKQKTMNVKYYSRNDGLDSDGTTSTAVSICDSQGRMLFTMVDGFAIYNSLKKKSVPVRPLVCIESIKVDDIIYKNSQEQIDLKPGTKRVEIKYTGLSFDAPERIQFTHQLTNFEDKFSSPDTSRTVSYTNLKPGMHTFYVSAINGEGLMSEQAQSTIFIQKPYIYQMPIFWIICSIVTLGTILIIFYRKQRAIIREKERLEKMVKIRTAELQKEKDKSDHLLRAILPDKIAEELKDEVHSIGENFADVTILFSDIVSFTKTSSGHSAEEIVNALNDLFSLFDDRAKSMGVEKIKTIGDAYMAACGLPTPNDRHAEIMVAFAKGMFEDLATYNKTAKIPFNMRVGLNCGPVNAGVIGKTKFLYDVWGNTVNVASRMETAASPGRIRVSQTVYEHLKDSGVSFTSAMECDIKGKGLMTTYEVV